jgi:hypothetical protein
LVILGEEGKKAEIFASGVKDEDEEHFEGLEFRFRGA